VGPQQTVYVPVEWLKKTKNEVVVLELIRTDQKELKGVDKPVLDELR
jgi:beta-galactosidase